MHLVESFTVSLVLILNGVEGKLSNLASMVFHNPLLSASGYPLE